MKLKTVLFSLSIVLLLTLSAATFSAIEYDGPLQDDTDEPCLGSEDPFCGEEGGGGTVDYPCRKCSAAQSTEWVKCEKVVTGKGDHCVSEIKPDGTVICNVKGDCS